MQTTMENPPLEACPSALKGMPIGLGIFPHRWVDAAPNAGASLFTAADGSQPKVGLWSKNLAEMILIVDGFSLNPDKAVPTTVRLDMDYAEGKPEIRTVRKELILSENCGKAAMKRTKAGEKTWIGRSIPIRYNFPDADIYSISKFQNDDRKSYE